MRKILCLLLTLIIFASSVSVFAHHEFTYEENFTFDEFDMKWIDPDEAVLMAVEDDKKAELEERLVSAWANFSVDKVIIEDLEIKRADIVNVYSQVFFENPYYFYVKRTLSAKDEDGDGFYDYIKAKYICADEENGIPTVAEIESYKKTWAEIDKATEEILFYISPDMTDFEKVMTVHDYMDLHYVYNIEDMDQTMLIMLDKEGVCAAYAEAFQHMMNILGIEGTIVSSEEMGHMWNMVKIGERWYHADITWDDPVPDQYARVCHEYMLLSTSAIKEAGHYGFTSPYSAISTTYKNAEWRDDKSSLVTVGGVMYRNEGNNLIDEEGNVIYENLDGGDSRWNVSETGAVTGVVWAGLCEVNNILYFNTDTGIFSYNPITKEIKCVLEEYGIGGLFADGNTIHYNGYDFEKQEFVKKGDLTVAGSFVKSAAFEDDKAVVRYYNDSENPVWIISCGENVKIHKIDAERGGTAQFDNGDNQTIFIWEQNLEPKAQKIELSK